MRDWFDTVSRLGLRWGTSFDLDFHTIPFHGEDALVEKHYISKRSRSEKGLLAFLAQDAETRVFCYANAELRKDQRDDEVLRFVEFWKRRTGRLPAELIFDCTLTTYAKLNELNRMKIDFITLRRRTPKHLAEIARVPLSAWRRVELENVARTTRHRGCWTASRADGLRWPDPPVDRGRFGSRGADVALDQPVEPVGVAPDRPLRPADDHREHHRRRDRLLPHGRAELGGGDEGQLRPATDLDGQQPVPAAGSPVGQGYEVAESRHLFRDLVDATAGITIGESELVVRYQRRAHNPLLIAAGFDQTDVAVPWLGGKRLRLVFG